MTMEQAPKIQEQFVAHLVKEFGEPVGYKAGLTNPAAQKAFGIPQPVRGTLLKKMLFKSGETLQGSFGIRPLSEGDLILRVSRDVIHHGRRTHDPGRLTLRAERMLTQAPRAVLLPASPVAPRGRTPPLLILGATTRDAGPAPREAGALWSRTGTPRRDRHAYSPSATVIAPLWAGPTVHRPGAPAQARRPSPAAPGPHAWYPTSGGPAG